jgi:type III restriction enzyme
VLSKIKPPMARIEFEGNYAKGINRATRILGVRDNLYKKSAGANMPPLEQYKDKFIISEINPFTILLHF